VTRETSGVAAATETIGTEDAAREAVALAADAGGRRVILGLAGPPGAGKSTIAAAIVAHGRAQRGADWAALLPMDGYHLSNAQLARLGLVDRKGAPATFDTDGYTVMLARVAADGGRDIYVPDYDRVVHHEPIAARLLIPAAARLVVTEGNYLALDAPHWRAARRHVDHLWYIEAHDELRESRLVERQLAGGREERAARDWVARSDRPNGELVKASKANADRVITMIPMNPAGPHLFVLLFYYRGKPRIEMSFVVAMVL
jgi:pantothenate kinase